MLSKIRLHAAGQLPTEYQGNLGKGFDLRCVQFLRVPYDDLKAQVLTGKSDDDVLS